MGRKRTQQWVVSGRWDMGLTQVSATPPSRCYNFYIVDHVSGVGA